MVEGLCATFEKYQLNHAIKIPKDISCRDSQCPNAGGREPLVPAYIGRRAIAEVMRSPVDLDA